MNGELKNNLYLLEDHRILYSAGHNIVLYNTEDKSQYFLPGNASHPLIIAYSNGEHWGHILHKRVNVEEVPGYMRESHEGSVESLRDSESKGASFSAEGRPGSQQQLLIEGIRLLLILAKEWEALFDYSYWRARLVAYSLEVGLV